MHNLPCPEMSFREIFQNCVSKIREPGREVLSTELEKMVGLTNGYKALATAGLLHNVEPHVAVGEDNGANHVKLYVGHLSNKESDLRRYYNKIKGVKRSYRCPYCGWAQIKQVDHFLPKEIFFRYSVSPYNLVPCCSDCNTSKGEYYGKSKSGSLFHPYFEQLPREKWLHATLCFTPEFSVRFSISDEFIDFLTASRIENEFDRLAIFTAYEDLSTHNLISTRDRLLDVLVSSGPAGLKEHLEGVLEQARTDSGNDLNNWKVSLYEEILRNEDFLSVEGLSSLL